VTCFRRLGGCVSRFDGVSGCSKRRVGAGVVIRGGWLGEGTLRGEHEGEGLREGDGCWGWRFSLLLDVRETERRLGYLNGELGSFNERVAVLGGRGGGDLRCSGASSGDASSTSFSQLSISNPWAWSCSKLSMGITKGTPWLEWQSRLSRVGLRGLKNV